MNYIKVVEQLFNQYKGSKFEVVLWDYKKRFFGQGGRSDFKLIIQDETTLKKLLSQGSIGFGESFMDGSLDIQGNIESYLKLRHEFKKIRFSLRLAIAKFLSNYAVSKNRKQYISYHYDLGNDFFGLILDFKTMSYSSGMYKSKTDSLENAQIAKIDFICKWLNLSKDTSVLDLGSGWGGFALHAARKYKLKVFGYTLSKAQLAYCQKLINKNNLRDKIKFEYRDMLSKLPNKKFDGVVMIESIEHVGKNNLNSFFKDVKEVLKDSAPFIIQLTGRYIPKRVDRWTLKYVFPGGYLPAKGELFEAAEKAGFTIEEFVDDTDDYIKTMTAWIKKLETNKEIIEKMFDKKLYRLWFLWMHGAKVNFELGEMSLFRIKLRNQINLVKSKRLMEN